MGCATKTIRMTRTAWSDGTSAGLFQMFTRLDVAGHKNARVSVILDGSSGSLDVTAAVIYANEEGGLSSATPASFPATGAANRLGKRTRVDPSDAQVV